MVSSSLKHLVKHLLIMIQILAKMSQTLSNRLLINVMSMAKLQVCFSTITIQVTARLSILFEGSTTVTSQMAVVVEFSSD